MGTAVLPAYLSAGNSRGESQDSLTVKIARNLGKVEERDRKGRIYASDGGRCEKAAALMATVPGTQVRTAALMSYAELGNAIEDIVVNALDDGETVLFKQYHLPEVGLNLGGYVDAIIYHQGRLRVLEVKSCGTVPRHPKPMHGYQAAIYSAITGLPATIFYFSRSVATFDNTLLTAQFDLGEQGALQRAALWRVCYAKLSIDQGLTPRVPMHLTKASDCDYCPFIPHCWEGMPAPVTWPEEVSPQQHVELAKQATDWVNKLLDEGETARRRIGILKHIEKHGGETAQRVLKGTTWSKLLGEDAEDSPRTPPLETLKVD